MFHLLLIAFWSQYAEAGVVAAPAPTPRAVLPRDSTVVGYASTGFADGTTLWDTITAAPGSALATSGTQVAVCPSTGCDWFSCSAEYAVFETTSIYCGGLSSSTCSYNRIYTDIHDQDPLTNYWCDYADVTGLEIYETTPTEGSESTPGITTTTRRSTPTSTPASATTSPTSPVPTSKKSTPIGAIVGGVVGGIVVIGIIIIAVVLLLRKKKSTPPPQPTPQTQNYYQQPNQGYFAPQGGAAAPLPEKTPAATAAMKPYYGESGPASPVPQYTPGSPPPQAVSPAPPMSPVPQYTPHNANMNELPAGRM